MPADAHYRGSSPPPTGCISAPMPIADLVRRLVADRVPFSVDVSTAHVRAAAGRRADGLRLRSRRCGDAGRAAGRAPAARRRAAGRRDLRQPRRLLQRWRRAAACAGHAGLRRRHLRRRRQLHRGFLAAFRCESASTRRKRCASRRRRQRRPASISAAFRRTPRRIPDWLLAQIRRGHRAGREASDHGDAASCARRSSRRPPTAPSGCRISAPMRRPRRCKARAHADVAIVGGGFTGLWTALAHQGTGAGDARHHPGSGFLRLGRLGPQWRTGPYLVRRARPGERRSSALEEARRLCADTADAIAELEQLQRSGTIDMDLRLDGWLWTASSKAQEGAWDKAVAMTEAVEPGRFRQLTAERDRAAHRLLRLLYRRRRGEGRDGAAGEAGTRPAQAGAGARRGHP